MLVDRSISKGQLVKLVFGQDAVAANQSDVQLPAVMGEAAQAVDGYTAPFAGDVVAITWTSSAAASAGSASVEPTVDGAADADGTLTVTAEVDAYKLIPRGKVGFVAGQRLGIELTTDASWNGTTADLVAVLHVLYHLHSV